MSWLGEHTSGAAIFAPAVVILAGATYAAWRANRPAMIPWLFLVVWLLAFGAHYFSLTVGRLASYYRSMWLAQLVTLAVLTAIPLVVALLPYGIRPVALSRKTQAMIGVALGLRTILAIPMLSEGLARLLLPWATTPRPRSPLSRTRGVHLARRQCAA